MDTRIIKAAVAVLILAWGIQQIVVGNIGWGVMLIIFAVLAGLIVFRSLRLIFAFFQLRRQDFAKSRKVLDKINPEKLWKKQQGYYFYLLGLTETQTNSLTQAEKYFKRALNLGLKMDHDKAMAKLNLAMIAANKRRKREATNLLTEVKKLDKRGMLKDQIKMAKDALKRI